MLSRKRSKVMKKEVDDRDIPTSVKNSFEINRLGLISDHLWLLSLITPITVTAVSTAYRYELPFDLAINKVLLYQTDAAGAASDEALNIMVEFLLPNGAPELYYDKDGVSWPSGGTRLTGRSLFPGTTMVVTLDGTATNLLEISLEVEVIEYGG